MTVIIKNNKERLINLGTREGHMLVFNPGEEKELSASVAKTFESVLEQYVDASLLTVVTKKKEAKLVDNAESAPVVKQTTKKATKKKTAKVSKE